MHTPIDINPDEFRRALTPQVIFSFQIVPGAILLSVLMFAAAVFYVASTTPSPSDPESLNTINILSIIHVFVATGCYLLSRMLYDRQFRINRDGPSGVAVQSASPAEAASHGVNLIRKATILRLALIEGPAFFGLAVCLIAALNGVLHEHPEYWGNGLSAVILVLSIIFTFPNSDRLTAVYNEKIRTL